jgi:hypothetical protein
MNINDQDEPMSTNPNPIVDPSCSPGPTQGSGTCEQDGEKRIVEQAWVERGGRGYIALKMFTGDQENLRYHEFYLDEPKTKWLVSEMEHAVFRGFGSMLNGDPDDVETCKNPLEETAIGFGFGAEYREIVDIGRPCECMGMEVVGSTVRLANKHGGILHIGCRDAEAAQRVGRQLAYNELTTIAPSEDIIKARFTIFGDFYAFGMSETEQEEVDARYWYDGGGHWRRGVRILLPMGHFDCGTSFAYGVFECTDNVVNIGTLNWGARLRYATPMAAELVAKEIRYGTKVILQYEPPMVSLCLVQGNMLYALGFTEEEKARLNEHYHPKTDGVWAMGIQDPKAYADLADIIQEPWDPYAP